ncbi:hypothetical protein EDE08_10427 [Bradyrhizobium sp. R2.2-H]|jgi:hypothetical protein|uniref:hypothetical protein n=1 Tax=unclassified Bradyrhizobium TaxID=2631580 RepID=UPI0010486667|nr:MULTISPECIES: hypothetical protein [unclassified Bradyrhizobium]TCU73945.1 hypothetical protein EDE10_104615 [Bradyrhizobium sp. Y-H1]TCU75865.1 hypothetical protein EDE08_10427 [Bradyrhizobium sp. R2.2-H]
MPTLDSKSFDEIWGTGGAKAPADVTGTRVLDPKDFESKWLTEPKAKPGEEPIDIGQGRAEGVQLLRGVPVLGAYADKAAAALNAAAQPFTSTPGMSGAPTFGERMAENERRIKIGADKYAEEHPVAAGIQQFAGGTAATAPLAATALGARALGLTGQLWQRGVAGATSGAVIGGADAAARSGGDLNEARAGAGIGATIGGLSPFVARVIGAGVNRVMAPAADRATNYLLQRAEALGIPVRPSQVSTSPFVQKMDQMVPKIPGSGMGKAIDEQRIGFNRAVAQTFGENATRITPDVMAAAKRRIGSEFDAIERGTTVRFDRPLAGRLSSVLNDASSVLEPQQMAPIANRITEISNLVKNGEFDGKTFNSMLKKGAPLNRLQKATDPNVRYYAGQIRTALQDALERSAPADMAQRYNMARYQYRNMKTVEPLAEKAATGDISPTLLLNEVRKANPNFAYGSGGDIADIARIGQRFMKQPPDSGTPLGTKVLDAFVHGAPALAGAALGTGAAYQGEFNPVSDIGLGVGGMLATALAARGAGRVMLRPQMIENALTRSQVLAPPVANRLMQINRPEEARQ